MGVNLTLNVSKDEVIKALKKTNGSRTLTLKLLKISRTALDKRIDKYDLHSLVKNGNKKATITPDKMISFPDIPSDDVPIEEVIGMMSKRFEKRNEAYSAKKWMPFNVASNEPIGICWFGDPHLDDDGCNWPLLQKDIDICKNTPGMYGANVGDSHNNWVGRLMKEYAEQETSEETAYKLIEWFFSESGINWLIMLIGNHDAWRGSRFLKKIAENICPMIDWRSQFKLVFPNGRECRIDAAHDHKGHSQWNSLHGQQKASMMGGTAHLYIAGHKHNWALANNECPHTNRFYWLARARGYKYIDSYSDNLGFGCQQKGASIVSVIDPNAEEINMVRCFADAQEGADYLTYLRNKNNECIEKTNN